MRLSYRFVWKGARWHEGDEEEMGMRKIWTMGLAVCVMTMATLALAGVWAQQEPPVPSNTPDEGAPPNGKPGHGGNAENRLENLSKQLNLTDAQKEKIGPLLKHEVERIREVRSNTSLTQGEARRRIAMIRRNTNQRIAEFLTPEQKKQWQDMRQERHGGGGPEGGQARPGGQGSPNTPATPQNPPNPN
jgi:Spy/CpxP family protein refolding chaperone